jgi:cysteinyl-tRNA synthetase
MRLYDSLQARPVEIKTRKPNEVSMYVCGLTVDGPPHLGHGRFALCFDLLRRWLEFEGNKVVHVSNITDVDDKIILRAETEGTSIDEVAKKYEQAWWEAVDALNVKRPSYVPHATQYIENMVNVISKMMTDGFAYETPDGIYLEVSKIKDYGALAHQELSTLKVGARVEVSPYKRSGLDFALWKFVKNSDVFWPSPWGNGRPGWHTECVVMSLDLLSDDFDIHGGAEDLIFPHHENERAQAEALGRKFARYWVHNGWVVVEGEKMSKSQNNFTTIKELLLSHDPRAYRLLVARSHYRSPVDVTKDSLKDAESALRRLDDFATRFNLQDVPEIDKKDQDYKVFKSYMDDDLDTPKAVAHIFSLINDAHNLADTSGIESAKNTAYKAAALCLILGLNLNNRSKDTYPENIKELLEARQNARQNRDFSRADEIRNELAALGFEVMDTPEGQKLKST